MVHWAGEQEGMELLALGLHLALRSERNHRGYVKQLGVYHFEMAHVGIAD